MKQLILASTSPRRKEILAITQLPFLVEASSYEEDMTLALSPEELAKRLSYGKASAVAKKHTNALVISADTFISFHNKVLGKPHTAERARNMLQMLSGKQHEIVTGYTIIDTDANRAISRSVTTTITFKELTQEEITAYINTGEPLDKAGGYALQQLGGLFIKRLDGDYFGAIGLPLRQVVEDLQQFGISVF